MMVDHVASLGREQIPPQTCIAHFMVYLTDRVRPVILRLLGARGRRRLCNMAEQTRIVRCNFIS